MERAATTDADKEREWLEFFTDILLPAGGFMALLASTSDMVAYFDESMDQGNLPLTVVAGYLFERDQYREFDMGMRAMLREHKICFFRMSECTHDAGQFEQHKGTDHADRAAREVIRLLRKHAVLGVAAGVKEARFKLLQPRGVEEILGGAYSMLCQWCLAEMGLWGDRHKFKREIAYFFESGCRDQSEANAAMSKIEKYPDFKKRYRYASHTFVPKMRMRGLQGADMLAWFARAEAEENDHILSGVKPQKRRLDFQALIGNTSNELTLIEHRFKSFDSETLKQHFAANSDPSMPWWD